jgi:hypothetical protein
MSAVQFDESRRMADVKRMISSQMVLEADLRMKGLPTDVPQRLIDILQCCLIVIEATQVAPGEDQGEPPPSVVRNEAA